MAHEQPLADALDDCLERVRHGQTIDEALAEHPPSDQAKLRPLVEIASNLGTLPEPNVSIQGLMRTLGRFGGQATASAEEKQASDQIRWFSSPVWGRVAAIVAIVFVVGWGTTNASATAMPGDLLYPVKMLTERARFILTLNAQDQAELRIAYSSRRLREAVAQQQRTGRIDPRLLDAMLEEARLAVLNAPELSEPNQQLLVAQAAHLTEYQHEALNRVAPRNDAQRQVVDQYRDMCRRRGRWMRQMLEPGGSTDQAPQQQPRQRRQNWGNWRNNCPRW